MKHYTTPPKVTSHILEDGDPRTDEAFCHCRKWIFRHPNRNRRMAEAHAHLVEVFMAAYEADGAQDA